MAVIAGDAILVRLVVFLVLGIVEFNAVNQEHSNYRSQVLLYSGSRPLKQAKLWCSAALRFRGAKARLRNLTGMALMFGFFFPCRFSWLHAR